MTLLDPIFVGIGAGIVALVLVGLGSHAHCRRRLGAHLGGAEAGRRLAGSDLSRVPWARMALVGLAAAATALAAAEPRWTVPEGEAPAPEPDREVVFALDVSASMQADDAVPSRLARAVSVVEDFLDVLGEERVGILLFAGQGYPLAPPTEDHEALRYLLSGVVPTIASAHDPGTLLSSAVREAELLFDPEPDGEVERTIVVIGDGEAGEPVSAVLGATRAVQGGGPRVHAIGVGTGAGSRVVMPAAPYQLGGVVVDANRRPVVSRLREETLIALADAGGGLYAGADDESALEEISRALERPAPPEIGEEGSAPPPRRDPWPAFVAAALALLLADSLLDARLRARWTRVDRPPR
jgi:Ca-activated chloride channel family protein